jgi:hypothetical protein
MHDREKSTLAQSDEADEQGWATGGEPVERMPETKGNAEQQSTLRTQSRDCR